MSRRFPWYVVALLIVGVVAVAPYFFGLQAQKTYKTIVQDLRQQGRATVLRSRYYPGWWSSRAETQLRLGGTEFTVQLDHRIHHGPWPLRPLLDGRFHWMPMQAVVDTRARVLETPKALPARMHTAIALDGNATSEITATDTIFRTSGGEEFHLKALNGTLRFAPDSGRVSGSFHTPGFSWIAAGNEFVAGKVGLAIDVHRGAARLGLGNIDLTMVSLRITRSTEPQKPARVFGLELKTHTRETGGQINTGLELSARRLEYGSSISGPGRLSIRLANLNAAALRQLEAARSAPEGDGFAVLGNTFNALALLAADAPQVEIRELSYKTSDGEIRGSGTLRIRPEGPTAGADPLNFLSLLEGQAKLRLPGSVVRGALAREVGAELDRLAARGEVQPLSAQQRERVIASAVTERLPAWTGSRYLRAAGNDFVVEARVADGALTVNGEAVKLPFSLPGG